MQGIDFLNLMTKGFNFKNYEGFDILDNRTQEQEDTAYRNVFESVDREKMTDIPDMGILTSNLLKLNRRVFRTCIHNFNRFNKVNE